MAIAPEEPAASRDSRVLRFKGHGHLRHRLVLSLISRRPVRIDEIRSTDEEPGLRECEVSFVRLLERISNGTLVEISYTGTSLLFSPGTLGGGSHTHVCTLTKSIGWFLEPILALAPFGKRPLSLTLKGVTTDVGDASVDVLRLSCLPHLALFLPSPEGLELKITKRGLQPDGGGEVTFACPSIKQVKPGFDFVGAGKISKIRGIAHSLRIAPQTSNRLVTAARGVLNRFIPDIYIYTDVYRGQESGKSPGYALTLLAKSTTGAIHSAEVCSKPRNEFPDADNTNKQDSADGDSQQTPEDLATLAASILLQEIEKGSCIDTGCEATVATLMTLGREGDVVRCLIGNPLTPFFVQHLRDLRDFLGTTFKITERQSADAQALPTIQLACIGNGYVNVAAKTS